MTGTLDLEAAQRALASGRPADAVASCQRLLGSEPDNVDALHVAGLALLQLGGTELGVELLSRAAVLRPGDGRLHTSLGRGLRIAGRMVEALESFAQAVRLSPNAADAWVLTGLTLNALGKAQDAEAAFRQAASVDAGSFEAWLNLANAQFRSGRFEEALATYQRAREIRPDRAEPFAGIGLVYHALLAHREAIPWLREALARDPLLPAPQEALADALWRVGAVDAAETLLLAAAADRPEDHEAVRRLVLLYLESGRAGRAREVLRDAIRSDDVARALAAELGAVADCLGADSVDGEPARTHEVSAFGSPSSADLAVGRLLIAAGQLRPAMARLQRAVAADPRNGAAWHALGTAALGAGQLRAAADAFGRAALDPARRVEAEYSRALTALLAGDYGAGWDGYEHRWCLDPMLHGSSGASRAPRWDGREPLAGRSLLVVGEQGIGDEIMFASLIPEVAAEAGQLVLAIGSKLLLLAARSFPRVRVVDRDSPGWTERVGPIDLHLPLGSLARFRRRDATAFPSHAGYLVADAARRATWRARLSADAGTKVGIAWRGGTIATGARRRSLAPEDTAPLRALAGIRLVNVQYASDRAEAERFAGPGVVHDQPAIDSLDETAALIAELDLVVTVCSAVVHLAGALGRPVWVLVPRVPEWRYGIHGEKMPWYPSARLFRQKEHGAWAPVIGEVVRAIGSAVGSRTSAGGTG